MRVASSWEKQRMCINTGDDGAKLRNYDWCTLKLSAPLKIGTFFLSVFACTFLSFCLGIPRARLIENGIQHGLWLADHFTRLLVYSSGMAMLPLEQRHSKRLNVTSHDRKTVVTITPRVLELTFTIYKYLSIHWSNFIGHVSGFRIVLIGNDVFVLLNVDVLIELHIELFTFW